MTNLYEFLRHVQAEAAEQLPRLNPENAAKYKYTGPLVIKIARAEFDWLEQYLETPDVEIHFKAKQTALENGEPVLASDWRLSGDNAFVFELLTEAMLLNANFAETVRLAAKYFDEHVPTCPDCQNAIGEAAERGTDWTLKPHKKIEV